MYTYYIEKMAYYHIQYLLSSLPADVTLRLQYELVHVVSGGQ